MQENVGGYGYVNDEEAISSGTSLSFGLNECNLTKFEWTDKAGKGGAEGEALDIEFTINGSVKSYRQFPVTKAFGKNNEEITDPKSPEMQEEYKRFNSIITHVLACFVSHADISVAFGVPITSFKQYCQIARGLLPKTTPKIPLQIFLQWQWQISGDNNRTFLEIPKKMKNGRWLCPSVPAKKADGTEGGSWKLDMKENPADGDKKALRYIDDAGNEHPHFIRNGWFVNSNFARQQKEDDDSAISAQPMNAAMNAAPTAPGTEASADANSGWD